MPSNIGLSGTKGINNYGKLNISNIIIKTIIKDSINIYNEESGNVNIENAKIINSDRYTYGFYSNLNENEYNFIYNLGIVKISDNTNIIIDTDLCYRKMNLYFLKNSKKRAFS